MLVNQWRFKPTQSQHLNAARSFIYLPTACFGRSIRPSSGRQHKYIICGNNLPTRCNRLYLLQILLLAQHVWGTIMPTIRSSRVLYRWSLPVVFGALVFKLSVWCGAEGYVSGLRAAALKQQPANRTHNPQLHTIPTTYKPKHQIPQAATICIILSSS